MKKIIYIANIRLPTEKAHGIQIMKMCEAMAKEGNEVTLIVPNRTNSVTEDPYAYYNVSRNFKIVRLNSPNLIKFGSVGFVLMTWIFSFLSSREVLKLDFDWVYSRDGQPLWVLSFFSRKFLFEAHYEEMKWWMRRVLLKGSALVAVNRDLIRAYLDFIKKPLKTLVATSGVDLHEFEVKETRHELKELLSFDLARKSILYTGHLYANKGADILASAGAILSEHDFIFVGGMQGDIDAYRERFKDLSNVKILGHRQHKEIAKYLKAADLLVIPNRSGDTFSASPIKLFEYMASGTPIVTSDVPAIREILDESLAYFFTPDDPQSLSEAIKTAFSEEGVAKVKALKAEEEVQKYSYTTRAKMIVAFLDTLK